MKDFPFKQPGVPEYMVRKHREMFDGVRSEVMDRLKGRSRIRDKRVGFGSIAAVGRLHRALALSMWKWRDSNPAEYPEWMGASSFADDPVTVPAGMSLATRMFLAEQFAEVAADLFDPDDVSLKPRAIEIVAATPERPPGIERGDEADVMAIELYEGVPMPKIIDRLVQIEVDVPRGWWCIQADYWLQVQLWHRAERINAARAMLGKDLPPVRVPGIPALRKRVDPMMDARIERERITERPTRPAALREPL